MNKGEKRERAYKTTRNKETGAFERKAVSDKEIRETIMKAYGITDKKEFRKLYDITKNKIYTYNAAKGKKAIASAQVFLYKEAKSRLTHGKDYKPSSQMRIVKSMQAYSKTKAKNVLGAKESRQYKNVQEKFKKSIDENMKELIAAHTGTKGHPSIVDQINKKYEDDQAKRLEALSAYAETLKDFRKNEEGKYEMDDEAPFTLGSVAGSPDITEFVYDNETFNQ